MTPIEVFQQDLWKIFLGPESPWFYAYIVSIAGGYMVLRRRFTKEVKVDTHENSSMPSASEYAYHQTFPKEPIIDNKARVARLVEDMPRGFEAPEPGPIVASRADMQDRKEWMDAVETIERLFKTGPDKWQDAELKMKFNNVELILIKGKGVNRNLPTVEEEPNELPMISAEPLPPKEDE